MCHQLSRTEVWTLDVWASLSILQCCVVFWFINIARVAVCFRKGKPYFFFFFFFGDAFGSRIPGQSILQGRLGRMFALWHRWENTHVSRRCYTVGYVCVEYSCRVSSVIVFCHTNGFMGLQKINNQGRSISTLVINVSPLGKTIYCAKPNRKC